MKLSWNCLASFHPMKCPFYFPTSKSTSTLCFWIIRTVQFNYISIIIFYHFFTFNEVSMFQTNLIAWEETEIFLRWVFHEILLFNIDLTRKRDLTHTHV